MEMLDVQQVIVGNEIMTASTQDIKQPVNDSSMHSKQHDCLQCSHCLITFVNPKSHERHMRKSHAEEYKQSLQETDTIFSCYMCDWVFSSSAKLTQHQASHTNEAKPFRCHYCNGSFPSFSALTNHRRQECRGKHFVCRYCGSVFRLISQLRSHVFTAHPLEEYNDGDDDDDDDDDTNTYCCDTCNRRFQTEEELLHHQETLAGTQNCDKPQPKKRGRPPKTTAERGMASAKKSRGAEEGRAGEEEGTTESQREGTKQMEHPSKEQQPQGELEIPCPENNCELVFPTVAALRAHKKEMHKPPPPPRKAHPCIECEESYAQPDQLKAHMARAHSPCRHNCSLCGKSFGRESNLRAHQKTHLEGDEAVDKGKS